MMTPKGQAGFDKI